MVKDSVTVRISSNLETRPIAMLVQVASQYRSSIYLERENRHVNAKSIMGMMTLGIDSGEEVTITAEGEDEQDALEGLRRYLTQEK